VSQAKATDFSPFTKKESMTDADIKVLYVEDSRSSNAPLREALKDEGLIISFCGGGFDALDELSEGGADIVVASVSLGDLNGFQVSALIKSSENTEQLPVVLLEDKLHAAQPEIVEFWSKPARCDLFVTVDDLKQPADVAASIKALAEAARKEGWDRSRGTSVLVPTQGFSSNHLMDSYRSLLDDLLLERIVSRFARTLLTMVEPRKIFLDTFFDQVAKLFAADMIGIVVADLASPWGAVHFGRECGKSTLDELTADLKVKLGFDNTFALELRGHALKDDEKSKSIKKLTEVEVITVGAGKQGVGALVFGTSELDGFGDSARAFMTLLGQELKPVLQLLLAKQEIEVLHSREAYRAAIDSLTGLYNLEFLVGFLQQQLLFSFRQRLPVGMVIVDLDNFSNLNQDFGYELGDLVITTVANRLLNVTRSSDLLARYGGDQFAVVLPNTDEAGARVLAEKVRTEIANLDFSHDFKPADGREVPHVTVSVGCANFNMQDLNPETILRDAKVALRSAKDAGRNRIASAPPTPSV
jgi:diguanylate cyclase (GGDEF)-like protein